MRLGPLAAAPLFMMGFGNCCGTAQQTQPPAKPYTLAQVWTLDAIYRDPLHGVTFRHPSIWKAETQYGYHAPALTDSHVGKPIAGFGYSEGGFPREQSVGPYTKTNLEGFGIVYSAVPAVSGGACNAIASRLSGTHRTKRVVLGGRSFAQYPTVEGGMSQGINGNLYATYANHTCYMFETDVAAAYAVEDVKLLTASQMREIDRHLQSIVESVRIVPAKR